MYAQAAREAATPISEMRLSNATRKPLALGISNVDRWMQLYSLGHLPLIIKAQPEETIQSFQTPLITVENASGHDYERLQPSQYCLWCGAYTRNLNAFVGWHILLANSI